MSALEQTPSDFTDWRQREFVSLQEAGRIVGRSRQWAVDAVEIGYLEAVRLPSGGPMVVTVQSLQRFTECVEVKRCAPKDNTPAGSDYKVEKGIPEPKPRSRRVYPWFEMEVGDSFFVQKAKGDAAKQAAYSASDRYRPKAFVAHCVEGGVRVWRIK